MRAVLLSLLFLLSNLHAEDSEQHVKVNIKSITCSGERKVESKTPVVAHDSIRDLKPKLKQLPFKNFDLVSSENVTIPIQKKQDYHMKNGDRLTLELLYLEDDRVGLWIDWKDKGGMDLLDTRLHFDCMETMLAGADTDSGNGKMLAITVEGKE